MVMRTRIKTGLMYKNEELIPVNVAAAILHKNPRDVRKLIENKNLEVNFKINNVSYTTEKSCQKYLEIKAAEAAAKEAKKAEKEQKAAKRKTEQLGLFDLDISEITADVYTIAEVAEKLRVSTQTIYNYKNSGKLKCIQRVKKGCMVLREDFIEFIKNKGLKTSTQIKENDILENQKIKHVGLTIGVTQEEHDCIQQIAGKKKVSSWLYKEMFKPFYDSLLQSSELN